MDLLSHYCGVNAFLSIVEGRSLRANLISASNDLQEGRWLGSAMEGKFAADPRTAKHAGRLADMLRHAATFNRAGAVCFSEEPNLLSQWRGYADDGHGFSMGWSLDYFDKLCKNYRGEYGPGFRIDPVSYGVEDIAEYANDLLEEVAKHVEDGALDPPSLLHYLKANGESEVCRQQKVRRFLVALFPSMLEAYLFKHPSFAEEREWRLLAHFIDDAPTNQRVEYRASRERLVPYVKMSVADLGVPPLKQVLLGPKNASSIDDVQNVLSKNGFHNVLVRRSDSPYR